MNKWLYRAVGTVGIASGIFLLGSGAAHANETEAAKPATDPQPLRGLFDDLLTPTAGLPPLGLSVDTPGTRVTAGLLPDGPVALRTNNGQFGVTAHLPAAQAGEIQDVFLAGRLPDLAGGRSARESTPELLPLPLVGDLTSGLGALPLVGGGDGGLGGLPLVGGGGGPLGGSLLGILPLPVPPDMLVPAQLRPKLEPTSVGMDVPGLGGIDVDNANRVGEEALPLVGGLPVLGGLLDGAGGGLPLVGRLPVVGSMLQPGGDTPGAGVGSPLKSLPLVGGLPLDGLPLVGGLLGSGPAAAPTGEAPSETPGGDPTGDGASGDAALPDAPGGEGPSADAPVGNASDDGTHRSAPGRHAGERPVAGEDIEYAESGRLTATEGLPLIGDLARLPLLGSLRSLPLIGALPLVNQLPVPMGMLRSLPVVG